MSLPVISNVYRCTWNFTNTGSGIPAEAHNVLHVRTTSEDEAGIANAMNTLLNGASAQILYGISSNFLLESISVLKLDGTSGTVVTTVTGSGGIAGGDFISQGCYVASHRTGLGGPAHRGRTYMGPYPESAQSNGNLDFTGHDVQGAWDDFRTGLSGDGVEFVVASYKLASASGVISTSFSPHLFTQRRRAFRH
jgi:hypothetical protein